MKNLILFLFVFSFWVQADENSIFVYCSEASPRFFNPQLATDGASLDATSDVYDGLVQFKRGSSSVEPALAVSWKASANGLSYTFKLRKGVSWHTTKEFTPRREFNADDVIFTFGRALNKNHPYHKISGGNYMYYTSMGLDSLVKKVVKVDDYTVRFELTSQNAAFLAILAMDFASILSKEYADQALKNKTPEMMDHKPVGTGPFVFMEYKKDSLIRYKTNKKYFRKPSVLEGVVFSITPDASVRLQKLKREECHLISFPLPSDYEAIKKHKKLKLIQEDVFNVGYLAMNVEKPPLDKVEVRQAVRHALNRSLYIQAIYLGNAKPAKGPLPPQMWSYHKGIKDYEYNVSKAKELLKKAGFEKGFEIDLWYLPVVRPYNPDGQKMGELMKEDLEKVGIQVKLVSYDWVTYLKKSEAGEHALIQIGWTSDNGDPDNFLGTLLGCQSVKSGTNLARWCHKEYNQLVTQGVQSVGQKKRSRLYKKAQNIFAKESPWAPLVHTYGFRGANKKVKGYILAPVGTESFYGVSLE